MIKTGIKGCWYYFWGHLFAALFYDKKYLRGRFFQGRMHGLCTEGWIWVTHDALGRLFSRNNLDAKYPVSSSIRIVSPQNIEFDPDDLNNFQSFGNYYQAVGSIVIGKGTYIAPNVGLITANHDISNLAKRMPPKPISIGNHCWIGMNSIVLGGVRLGDQTIVGAGSIVTKSFPEGKCVIAGNPAKVLRYLSDSEINEE